MRTIKNVLGCLGLVALAGAAAAQEDEAERQVACEKVPFSILVNVKNVSDDRGTITLDVHGDNPEAFLKSGAKLSRTRIPATPGDMNICLPVDKAGVYAVVLYHDRDAD